ncbi:MAG: DUF1059 domain-containing protein, partial [Planctomycetes bacterium]|nr:DUF1059 domain-containing protein [Planctomycetota bacterium]
GEHAAKDHNLQITPELAAKVKALIKEVQS